MLKLAYQYKDKLNKEWQNIIFNDRYKFYNFNSYWSYNIELEDSSWNKIQMVSVDKYDNVIGFLSCSYCIVSNKASSIGAVNFKDVNPIFSKDLFEFLDSLFTKHNLNKIEWTVVIGNPAEKMYDRIIKEYGGSIVGVLHESTKLYDGTLCDVKEYELFKKDYLRNKHEVV